MSYASLIGTELRRAAINLGTAGRLAVTYVRSHPRKFGVGLLILIIALIAISFFIPSGAESPTDERKSVTLTTANETGAELLVAIGEVRSLREAEVSIGQPGRVIGVYYSLGDAVGRGAVIAETENSRERAGVSAAEATLQKAKSGVASQSISEDQARTAVGSQISSSRAALASAYAAIDDSISRKTDDMFSNPTGIHPTLNVVTSNSNQKIVAENGRSMVTPILNRQSLVNPNTIDESVLSRELDATIAESVDVQSFISNLLQALSGGVATNGMSEATISGYKATANAALASVQATHESLIRSRDTLIARRADLARAEEGLTSTVSGQNADIQSAEAGLAVARAGLEQTLLRAPLSGTINKLAVTVGTYISPGQPVVYISNAAGLEVTVFLSERDIGSVKVGSTALVGGTTKGTVSKVADALDPRTRKAEIRIVLPENAPFVSGQSATVAIERSVVSTTDDVIINLSSIKITPAGAYVFEVIEGKLKTRPVTLGDIRGATVVIESGIDGGTRIVKDARGLKEDQEVMVAN
ncbi:MAG: efflux RND transporter periplasmic adaptor subunit [Patescibacteria group bacterium]